MRKLTFDIELYDKMKKKVFASVSSFYLKNPKSKYTFAFIACQKVNIPLPK